MQEPLTITAVLPAAGFGRRMRGGDKLLEQVSGEPLLRRLARMAGRVLDHVVVALPAPDGARAEALSGLNLTVATVKWPEDGMSSSLVAGVEAAPEGSAYLVLPADMPEITEEDLALLAAAFRAGGGRRLVRATDCEGRPGHPVIFPADCRAALLGLSGDAGAREVLRANRNRLESVALPGRRALVDLDTPEDWAEWRATQAAGTVDRK
ncbi:NTP transferase domain-containing protein [Roseivivax sp. GX 12232]|uniref:nucleotidyltransferase family protein n=1 Tax=Roseivivax sp. GX 12232 TaxID=2900547 RepID=UPI00351D8538